MSEIEKNAHLENLETLHEKFIKFIQDTDPILMKQVNFELQRVNEVFYYPDTLKIDELAGSSWDPNVPPDADAIYASVVAELFHSEKNDKKMDFFLKNTYMSTLGFVPSLIGNTLIRIHRILTSNGVDVLVVSKELRKICLQFAMICEDSTKLQDGLQVLKKEVVDEVVEVEVVPGTPTSTPALEDGEVAPDAPLKKRKSMDDME